MADDNKPVKPAWPAGRYMRYAIGEIVLVVIGILIALQINNWNETRKINNNIESVFTLFEQELENNIYDANDFLRYGYWKDSIKTLFNNNEVTPEMIKAYPGLVYRDFGTNTQQYLHDGLDEIISLEKQLPEHYRTLITELKKLKTRINSQKFWEGESLNLAASLEKEHVGKFTWYDRYDSLSLEKAIRHALTDSIYRNKVNHYTKLLLNENVWDATLIRTSSIALLWRIKSIKGEDNSMNIKQFFDEHDLKPLLEYTCGDKPYRRYDINFRRNFIIYNNTNDSISLYSIDESGKRLDSTELPPKQFLLEQFSMRQNRFLEIALEYECSRVFKLYKEDYLLIE